MESKPGPTTVTATPKSQALAAPSNVAEEFLQKLRNALKKDGDFPASAKIVNELRLLTQDPKTTANQITEVILREPSLGVRVLHLVNSSFYRRSKPIMTVSQAVVQIGMKPLSELCAGLVLLRKFVPVARRGGAFSACLQKTILTSLLSSSLASETLAQATNSPSKNDECGYLVGSFSEMGTLLLAYYFPQVYEAAVKRAEVRNIELAQSIREITGLTPLQLSLEVVQSLDLPPFYKDVLQATSTPNTPAPAGTSAGDASQLTRIAKSLTAAREISNVIINSRDKNELDKVIAKTQTDLKLDGKMLQGLVGQLPQAFVTHCEGIELKLPALPSYVASYDKASDSSAPAETPAHQSNQDPFAQYVEEIRQAVESGESTASIITTVMETLAWHLKFERVLLLLLGPGKRKLQGRMILGKVENFDPKKVDRAIGAEASNYAPDARAYRDARPVFIGDPVIAGGWPFVAIPIGFGQRSIGVIYADRISGDSQEINPQEQAAIGVLSELLDRSISINS